MGRIFLYSESQGRSTCLGGSINFSCSDDSFSEFMKTDFEDNDSMVWKATSLQGLCL